MNDPLKFLERCPELESIARIDPAVMSAIARSDGVKLHKALSKHRLRNPGRADGAFLDQLLLDRRFFLTPLKKPPSMHTLNTVGTRLSGKSDLAEDGTYVATLYFVTLFIPLMPIGSYLVSDGGNNSWHFYGRVPLETRAQRIGKIFGALLLLSTLFSIGSYLVSGRTQAVHVLNGLSQPIVASVGGDEVTVPAKGRLIVQAKTGSVRLRARDKAGRVIEELDAKIPAHTDLVAYNVLGIAPIYRQAVVYTTTNTGKDEDPALIPMVGGSLVVHDRIDFVFSAPPETMKMSGSRMTKTRVALGERGWIDSLVLLKMAKREAEIPGMVDKVTKLFPDEKRALEILKAGDEE